MAFFLFLSLTLVRMRYTLQTWTNVFLTVLANFFFIERNFLPCYLIHVQCPMIFPTSDAIRGKNAFLCKTFVKINSVEKLNSKLISSDFVCNCLGFGIGW